MFSMIVAMDESDAIGYQGWMPWDLKEDLKLFKSITLNHKIVMGKTTFLGLKTPLKQRQTLVLSTTYQSEYPLSEVQVYRDVESIVNEFDTSEEEVIICGGAQVYEAFLPYYETLYISRVHGKFSADTYFPKLNLEKYEVVEQQEFEGFTFYKYQLKK